MNDATHPIYIGTLLLEPNRHRPGRVPTFLVSEWIGRFQEAGLDGIELWENHAALASAAEVAALGASPLPVTIFNSYITFCDATPQDLQRLADLLAATNAQGVKFNFTRDASRAEEDIAAVATWRETLPAGMRVFCECHPGTIVEEPSAAARVFDRLGRDRYEAMVHPFTQIDRLGEWFAALGPMITHAHVQIRDAENRFERLDRQPDTVRRSLDAMRAAGFTGSFTLEFTEGANQPGDTPERMWENALHDLAYLRAALR